VTVARGALLGFRRDFVFWSARRSGMNSLPEPLPAIGAKLDLFGVYRFWLLRFHAGNLPQKRSRCEGFPHRLSPSFFRMFGTVEKDMGKGLSSLYDKTRKPASETEEGKLRLDEYYLALGRFAHWFAQAELAVHSVLAHYANLSTSNARALFSGVRARDTKSLPQRLHELGTISEEEWIDAEPVFQQLTLINSRRNDIFHHGASSIAEGVGIVSNAAMAHIEERITGFEISPHIPDDMTADIRKILTHLYIRHMGRPRLLGKHPQLDEILLAPWRYKPKQLPAAKSRKPASSDRTKSKSRKAPPEPSLE
jgi:hypothetical protein